MTLTLEQVQIDDRNVFMALCGENVPQSVLDMYEEFRDTRTTIRKGPVDEDILSLFVSLNKARHKSVKKPSKFAKVVKLSFVVIKDPMGRERGQGTFDHIVTEDENPMLAEQIAVRMQGDENVIRHFSEDEVWLLNYTPQWAVNEMTVGNDVQEPVNEEPAPKGAEPTPEQLKEQFDNHPWKEYQPGTVVDVDWGSGMRRAWFVGIEPNSELHCRIPDGPVTMRDRRFHPDDVYLYKETDEDSGEEKIVVDLAGMEAAGAAAATSKPLSERKPGPKKKPGPKPKKAEKEPVAT